MEKQLKFWNGRAGYSIYKGLDLGDYHMNIAAYTRKQAIEFISEISGTRGAAGEIDNYFAKCWGNDMNNVKTTEPGVWLVKKHTNEPIKII